MGTLTIELHSIDNLVCFFFDLIWAIFQHLPLLNGQMGLSSIFSLSIVLLFVGSDPEEFQIRFRIRTLLCTVDTG